MRQTQLTLGAAVLLAAFWYGRLGALEAPHFPGLVRWTALGLALLVVFLRRRGSLSIAAPLGIGIALTGIFVAVAALSSLFSTSSTDALLRAGSFGLLLLVSYRLALVAAPRLAVKSVLAGNALACLAILAVSLSLWPLGLAKTFWADRYRGIVSNPNGLAAACCLALPYLTVSLLGRPSPIRFLWVSMALTCLWLSGSRAGLGGSLAGTATAVWCSVESRPRRALVGFASGAAAVAVVLFALGAGFAVPDSRAGRAAQFRLASVPVGQARRAIMKADVRRWRKRPTVGVGLGASADWVDDDAPVTRVSGDSSYTALLAETGVMGLGMYAAFLGVVVVVGVRRSLMSEGGDRRVWAAATGTVVGIMVHSVAELFLASVGCPPTVLLWILGFLILAGPRREPLNGRAADHLTAASAHARA